MEGRKKPRYWHPLPSSAKGQSVPAQIDACFLMGRLVAANLNSLMHGLYFAAEDVRTCNLLGGGVLTCELL
jgi:hypothetical protein